jgi:hypothetical protein
MSWEPLHAGEPFKGSVAGIRAYGSKVTETGELIGEQAGYLRQLANPECWQTDTAEAFREKANELADKISQAQGRYEGTGAALTTFADQLGEHRVKARALVVEAAPLESVANSEEAVPEPAPDGSPGELTPGQQQHNRARSAAQQRLAELQREFDRLVTAAENDAADAEAKINNVKDDDVKDDFWDKHAGWIRTVAGLIAAIAAIVLLTVATGGLIWFIALGVALVAGAIALAMSIGRLMYADGSWFDVVTDAVGLLTLGVGGTALGLLARGLSGLRGAYSTFQGARATAASLGRLGGIPWRLSNWAARSRIPIVTSLGQRGRTAMLNTANAAGDAARAAAAALPSVNRVQRFVMGGTDNAQMVSYASNALRTLRSIDDVPAALLQQTTWMRRLGTTGVVALNVGAANEWADVLYSGMGADTPANVVEIAVDLIERLR